MLRLNGEKEPHQLNVGLLTFHRPSPCFPALVFILSANTFRIFSLYSFYVVCPNFLRPDFCCRLCRRKGGKALKTLRRFAAEGLVWVLQILQIWKSEVQKMGVFSELQKSMFESRTLQIFRCVRLACGFRFVTSIFRLDSNMVIWKTENLKKFLQIRN